LPTPTSSHGSSLLEESAAANICLGRDATDLMAAKHRRGMLYPRQKASPEMWQPAALKADSDMFEPLWFLLSGQVSLRSQPAILL